MAELYSYDSNEVSIIYGGETLTGLADGAFVNIERDTDNTVDVSGADGTVTRAKQNDKRGNIVVTMQATSPSNAVLTRRHREYEDGSGTGLYPVIVKDNNGNSVFSSSQAWVLKPAASPFSKNVENREWTLRCFDLSINVEGN